MVADTSQLTSSPDALLRFTSHEQTAFSLEAAGGPGHLLLTIGVRNATTLVFLDEHDVIELSGFFADAAGVLHDHRTRAKSPD